jgi:hypothetical protein
VASGSRAELGAIPTARCNPDNAASRRTLQRAGFAPCAQRNSEKRDAVASISVLGESAYKIVKSAIFVRSLRCAKGLQRFFHV